VPERHGQNPGDTEDQREGQEVPFLPEEVDICILKKFHSNPKLS
jgi:hypothetical protein